MKISSNSRGRLTEWLSHASDRKAEPLTIFHSLFVELTGSSFAISLASVVRIRSFV